MFNTILKINAECLADNKIKDLERWMDNKFQLNMPITDGDTTRIVNVFGDDDRELIDQKGMNMRNNCPESMDMSLFYIRLNTMYSQVNHLGRYCLYHVWPLFFEKFPLGQIWVIQTNESWWEKIWEGQKELSTRYNQDYPEQSPPQQMTGLLTEEFQYNSLNMLSYGIYPLILSNFFTIGSIFSGLTFLYIPDTALKHSQMTEANTLYTRILWDLHDIFDDQWTFDGSRGPKSSGDHIRLNPLRQLDYFQWFIKKIDERMKDIVTIEDPLIREQLVMTVNRIIVDAQLSVTAELPYISKVFFFNFLDKLANIMTLLNNESNDTDEWKKLVSKDFICNNVLKSVQEVPNEIGEYLVNIVTFAVKEMEYSELNPLALRDIRNTNHGYNLRPNIVNRLMEKDGEINNNIPLIVTPYLLYLFSIPWKIS